MGYSVPRKIERAVCQLIPRAKSRHFRLAEYDSAGPKNEKIQSARKNEILRGCDHVLRRLENERSCPMGYSVPRKIECHSAAFYLCSGHYIP